MSTPMGTQSSPELIIENDGETGTVTLDDGNGGEPRPIAWQAPGSSYADFKWLVESAANFHGISFTEAS